MIRRMHHRIRDGVGYLNFKGSVAPKGREEFSTMLPPQPPMSQVIPSAYLKKAASGAR